MKEALRMSARLTGKEGIQISSDRIFSYPIHSHSYFEMLYYEPFWGSITVNDTTLVPQSPLAVVMTPSDLHGITVSESKSPARFIKFAFTEDCLGGYLSGRLHGAAVLTDISPSSVPAELFAQALSSQCRDERIILLRCLILQILQNGQILSSPSGEHIHTAVARAVSIINDEFPSDLTLRELSERLNLSPQHLSECFSSHMGISFSAYLCDIRLRHAAASLRSTDHTVTEICYECGYRNLSHFLRSFKRRFGETPKEYRKHGAEAKK